MKRISMLTVLVILVSGGAAFAQSGGHSATGGYIDATRADNLGAPGSDENYVDHSLRYANVDVVFSRLAEQKASDTHVRSLAKQVEKDQMTIGGGLVADAKALNVKIPAGLPPEFQADFARLHGLTGNEFDREYLKVLVHSQQQYSDLMRDEAGAGGSKNQSLRDQADRDERLITSTTEQAEKLLKNAEK